MPLGNRNLLDDHIKRTVARRALHRIHDIIEDDAYEERRGVRFAGLSSSLAFGAIFGFVAAVLAIAALSRDTSSGLLGAIATCAVAAAVSFTFTHYFVTTYPRRVRRHAFVAAAVTVVGAAILFIVTTP